MFMLAMAIATSVSAISPAVQDEEKTKIYFTVPALGLNQECADIKKGIGDLTGVANVDVRPGTHSVEVTLKPDSRVKLSDLRAAVKKAGKTLSIDEGEIAITGKVRLSTSLSSQSKEARDALAKVENMVTADALAEDPSKFELVAKGAKLSDICKALDSLLDKRGSGSEEEVSALQDVEWVSPAPKKRKGSGTDD